MRFLAFLFLVVVTGIGWLRLMVAMIRHEEDRLFVDSYIRKFKSFSEAYGERFDPKQYDWLTHRVMKVQVLSGDSNKWRLYGDQFALDAAKKSQGLVSMLDQMGQQPVPIKTVTSTISFLIRYLGVLDDFIERYRRRRLNPLVLFREGIQMIILAPMLAFSWARGAGSEAVLLRVSENPRFRRWVAFFSLVGLVFPVLVMIIGWEPLENGFTYLWALCEDGFYRLRAAIESFLEEPSQVPSDAVPVTPDEAPTQTP